ncbi:hypothetical protein FHG87_025238 [Trinorchestia longiramus]|nr:hypothetical protein FHG87_025238 [Trinorchestia longiramus]
MSYALNLLLHHQVRQNYIRRRLVSTYRALQRYSQSSMQLQSDGALGVKVEAGGITLVVPGHSYQTPQDIFKIIKKEVELVSPFPPNLPSDPTPLVAAAAVASSSTKASNAALTAQDVERDRGRQLSKYERNIMIFNWLQTLEETTYDMMA